MDRILRGDEDLHRQELEVEDRELESGNRLAARTLEEQPDETYPEDGNYPMDIQEPELPGPGVEADRVQFPLETYEEEEERAPAVTGSLVQETFTEDSFEATYEFRAETEYSGEMPMIAQLDEDQIEHVLESGNDDMNVTVTGIENGLMVTAQYEDPNSATEAVYEVNQVVNTLDQITDLNPE